MKELSLNILDLLENSAAAKSGNVSLSIEEDDINLHIVVQDDGQGIMGETSRLIDPFYSSKNKKVGLGIPFVQEIVDLCSGSLIIDSQPGIGTSIRISLSKNCIDLPPLGNIISTIMSFLTLHPDINLSYKHSYNNNSFIFNSQEFKNILEEIPINHPEVLKIIDIDLENNLKYLYGGKK